MNDTVDETFTDICSTGGGAQEEKLGQQEEAESLSGQIGLRKNAQLRGIDYDHCNIIRYLGSTGELPLS